MGKFTRELSPYYRSFFPAGTPERFIVTVFVIRRWSEVAGARDSIESSQFSGCLCGCTVAVEEITLVLFTEEKFLRTVVGSF